MTLLSLGGMAQGFATLQTIVKVEETIMFLIRSEIDNVILFFPSCRQHSPRYERTSYQLLVFQIKLDGGIQES